MNQYTVEQMQNAFQMIESSIASCEKIRPKLKQNSPQFSLNTNRLKSLYIAKTLMEEKQHCYTSDELEKAIIQITSIRNKSMTGIRSAKEGTGTYTRFRRIIAAMDILLDYLQNAINADSKEPT